jgi:hypothetical protein
MLNFIPDVDFGDHASIGANLSAFLDEPAAHDIANLTVNGTLDIRTGGSLVSEVPPPEIVNGVGGNVTVGGAGILQIATGGSLSAQNSITNNGRINLTGSGGVLQSGGTFTNGAGGSLWTTIDSDNPSFVDATGAVSLAGTLRPSFDGVTPEFGDSWKVVEGGSFSGNFATINTSGPGAALPAGLRYVSRISGNEVRLEVDNNLVLSVHRLTGEASIKNLLGEAISIKGYSIGSGNGFLDPVDWDSFTDNSVGGWREANPSINFLSELNLLEDSTLNVGSEMAIGPAYAFGPQGPSMEDLTFDYISTSGEVVRGLVQYEGPVNNMLLRVDPETGEGAISNLSPLYNPADLKGYSILSASGALLANTWSSFTDSGDAGEGWREANPSANALSELNLLDSTPFPTNTIIPIGTIFDTDGLRDLAFEFIDANGAVQQGTVEYDEIPVVPGLPADFDGNGEVDLVDFNTLKDNFGIVNAMKSQGDADGDGDVDLVDFNVLKDTFGQSGAAAVPEPSTIALALMGLVGMFFARRRSRA